MYKSVKDMLEAKVAYMFAGQGSQKSGMWQGLEDSPAAREIFQLANRITGNDLYLDDLKDTSKVQPAIVAHSLAALAAAREVNPERFAVLPAYYLGHSVGEYAALAAAGAIDIKTTIYLVKERGRLMEEAGRLNPGKMAALLGPGVEEQISSICQQTGAEAANFNCPGQIVISGRAISVEDAVRLAGERNIRGVLLDVSVASHSSLMESAKIGFETVLEEAEFKEPENEVISNVTAKPYKSAAEIRQLLPEQLVSSVLWEQSIRYVIDKGVNAFIEFGPQPVLTGLLKRINREARGFCISNFASLTNLPPY